MPKAKPKPSATDWVRSTKPRQSTPCLVCDNPAVRDAVAEFYGLKRDGETALSWAQFVADYLGPVLGWDRSVSAVTGHVRKHLQGGA